MNNRDDLNATRTGGHNIVTGDESITDAGETGLAGGAIVGGLIGTAVGGPIGAVVGGAIGSLAGGVAGDAAEAADTNVGSPATADLTSGANADYDPTVNDNAYPDTPGDSLNRQTVSGNDVTARPTNPPSGPDVGRI